MNVCVRTFQGVGTTGSISEDTIRRFLVRMQERIAEMEESAKLEKVHCSTLVLDNQAIPPP